MGDEPLQQGSAAHLSGRGGMHLLRRRRGPAAPALQRALRRPRPAPAPRPAVPSYAASAPLAAAAAAGQGGAGEEAAHLVHRAQGVHVRRRLERRLGTSAADAYPTTKSRLRKTQRTAVAVANAATKALSCFKQSLLTTSPSRPRNYPPLSKEFFIACILHPFPFSAHLGATTPVCSVRSPSLPCCCTQQGRIPPTYSIDGSISSCSAVLRSCPVVQCLYARPTFEHADRCTLALDGCNVER
mmetsp:Transcript_17034/g.36532  ORF Transcript_17034/g.36532 Transcript_17034/m.36532 type:complete len:242 (-) Transcript_17034:339-1064(-)